jgi:hypothetical protein
MNYVAEMGSRVIVCITSLMDIDLAIQKLFWGICIYRQQGDRINLLLFFKIRKAGISVPTALLPGKGPSVTIVQK